MLSHWLVGSWKSNMGQQGLNFRYHKSQHSFSLSILLL